MTDISKFKLLTFVGKEIAIPPRLSADINQIDLQDFDPMQNLTLAKAETLLCEAAYAHPVAAATYSIKAAFIFSQLQSWEQAILSLNVYVDKRVRILVAMQAIPQAIALLTDTLVLAHTVLPYTKPEWIRDLTLQMVKVTETVFSIFAPPLIVDLTLVVADVIAVLNIAQVIWEPTLKPPLRSIAQCVSDLSNDKSRVEPLAQQDLLNRLVEIQEQLTKATGHHTQTQKHLFLLKHFVNAIIEITHKLFLQYGGAALPRTLANFNLELIVSEVQELIRQLEQELRKLIAEHYEKQFGIGWIQHIAAKHQQMYSYWTQTMQKDRTAFQSYQAYDPQILEYARFQDLTELINAQWHLFHNVLDFGEAKRDRAIFSDKMKQIALVRNPLAHHRSIPENEVLRAKVLCTDILMILAQANQRTDAG